MAEHGHRGWSPADRQRAASFALSVVAGLSSGSNYVYSAYAPQLADALMISSTHANLIGAAGNLGVYMSGPLWGRIVDARGPRIPLLVGSACLFFGYLIVHAYFIGFFKLHEDAAEPPSKFGLFVVCAAMYATGLGGSAGLTSAMNAVAKSFPDKTRASATGSVLAGFGLSAFAFSTLGHTFFEGNGASLVKLLAFGTGVPIFIGSFFIRVVPPETIGHEYEPIVDEANAEDEEEEVAFEYATVDALRRPRSTSLEMSRSRSPAARGRSTHAPVHAHFEDIVEVDSNSPLQADRAAKYTTRSQSVASVASISPTMINFTPGDLVVAVDFWILFVVLSLLCGVGLMYINNAGTVALALGRGGKLIYDKKAVSAWQAKQVATVSVWNCLGRIIGGLSSDFCKTRYKLQRVWFLPIVSLGFIASQMAALDTFNVKNLWIVSSLLGISYGALFNVIPMLVLEWFGMPHFSQNYGWTAVAPVLGGNGFNLLFGKIYDSNTIGKIGMPDVAEGHSTVMETIVPIVKRLAAAGGVPDEAVHDCIIGAKCYATSFKLSTVGCIIAFGLSILAGFRRERKRRQTVRG